MIEIVCEFVVKEEARGQFELAYGPGGAWSKLFARCPGFRGTTLLRDTKNPRRYLTIDFWDTLAQREQMLAERKAEYSNLDTAFADWTESETERLLALWGENMSHAAMAKDLGRPLGSVKSRIRTLTKAGRLEARKPGRRPSSTKK